MNFDQLLRDEIADEFKQLKGIEVGTDEFKTTVDGLTKLVDRAIEIEKIDLEAEERSKKNEEAKALAEFEKELKLKQMEDERIDRLIRNCIAVAGIVLPLGVTIWGTLKSFKFEEEGTVTTIMGRGFINKLLPKK